MAFQHFWTSLLSHHSSCVHLKHLNLSKQNCVIYFYRLYLFNISRRAKSLAFSDHTICVTPQLSLVPKYYSRVIHSCLELAQLISLVIFEIFQSRLRKVVRVYLWLVLCLCVTSWSEMLHSKFDSHYAIKQVIYEQSGFC